MSVAENPIQINNSIQAHNVPLGVEAELSQQFVPSLRRSAPIPWIGSPSVLMPVVPEFSNKERPVVEKIPIEKVELTEGFCCQIDLAGFSQYSETETKLIDALRNNRLEAQNTLNSGNLDASEISRVKDSIRLASIGQDLVSRGISKGVNNIAELTILIADLGTLAKELGLDTLNVEGDLIRVHGIDPKKALEFALISKQIINKYTSQNNISITPRCGICAITDQNPLVVYKENGNPKPLTTGGKGVERATEVESDTNLNGIGCDEATQAVLENLNIKIDTTNNRYAVGHLNEEGSENQTLIEECKNKAESFAVSNEILHRLFRPSITNAPVAYMTIDLGPDNIEDQIAGLKADLKTCDFRIAMFPGLIQKYGKIKLPVILTSTGATPCKDMVDSLELLTNLPSFEGRSLTVGVSYGPIRKEVLESNGQISLMGSDTARAARLAVPKVDSRVEQTNIVLDEQSILLNTSFSAGLAKEGYSLSEADGEVKLMPGKGFSNGIPYQRLTDFNLQELEYTKNLESSHNVTEILGILETTLKKHWEGELSEPVLKDKIGSLINIIISYTGLSAQSGDNRLEERKFIDLVLLAKTSIGLSQTTSDLTEIVGEIVRQTPRLQYGNSIVEKIGNNDREIMENLASITFGRVYEFDINVAIQALDISRDKLEEFERNGFLTIKENLVKLTPPISRILEIQSSQEKRKQIHAKIVDYLQDQSKKYTTEDENWLSLAQECALHAREIEESSMTPEVKRMLSQLNDIFWKEKRYPEILLYTSRLLDIAKGDELIRYQFRFGVTQHNLGNHDEVLKLLANMSGQTSGVEADTKKIAA